MKTITSKILGFLVILSSVALLSCSKKVDTPSTSYDVFLTDVGTQSADVIGQIRLITGLGLKESKALVDISTPTTPQIIKSDILIDEANQIKKQLTDLGATVDIKPHQP